MCYNKWYSRKFIAVTRKSHFCRKFSIPGKSVSRKIPFPSIQFHKKKTLFPGKSHFARKLDSSKFRFPKTPHILQQHSLFEHQTNLFFINPKFYNNKSGNLWKDFSTINPISLKISGTTIGLRHLFYYQNVQLIQKIFRFDTLYKNNSYIIYKTCK